MRRGPIQPADVHVQCPPGGIAGDAVFEPTGAAVGREDRRSAELPEGLMIDQPGALVPGVVHPAPERISSAMSSPASLEPRAGGRPLAPHGIKLLDFGLARPAGAPGGGTDPYPAGPGDRDSALHGPRAVAGRAGGRPHRRVRGRGAAVRDADGKPAFGGETAYEACHAILHAQPPALAGSPEVASLDGVIQRALEKRPDQRYPTAEVMANDLRHALAHMHAPDAARVQTLTRLMVLPFRLLRSDPEIDFLAFSLPDAITTSLSGLESLVVRSSHAAARYTGEAVDLKAIASESEVDALVLGTLLRAGDQVRVSAQLVEAPSARSSGRARRSSRSTTSSSSRTS